MLKPAKSGGNSVGAVIGEKYADAQYLIAVEDMENGLLNGEITALIQAEAAESGNLNIPDNLGSDGMVTNIYGTCRHPKTHTCCSEAEGYGVFCDICGARISPIVDLGGQEQDDILIGDANCDGHIDIRDVTAIQRHIAEHEILTGDAYTAADANGDGRVDINDATHLQMYLAEYGVTLGKRS